MWIVGKRHYWHLFNCNFYSMIWIKCFKHSTKWTISYLIAYDKAILITLWIEWELTFLFWMFSKLRIARLCIRYNSQVPPGKNTCLCCHFQNNSSLFLLAQYLPTSHCLPNKLLHLHSLRFPHFLLVLRIRILTNLLHLFSIV